MRLLYSLLLYLAVPFVLLRMLWRSLRQPEYRRRLGERFGFVPPVPGGVAVWVHAVSVGETVAALPLVRALLERHPGRVLLTTGTTTGSERVRAALGGAVLHTYAPWDLPDAVARFLRRVQPHRVVVVETEIWPNLFRALARRGTPPLIANARLSPRSFRGYARVAGFTRATLADTAGIAAQSEADAERFRALGAPAGRVSAVGNLKFDAELPVVLAAQGAALRSRWGADRPVWIAASTHEGEEAAALDAHRALLARQPQAVLLLVPRHPQRFDAVARLVAESGLRWARRSAPTAELDGLQVLLGDSMGEMPTYFGAADVAFVGGSLVPVGGHNVLEPAALGLPVLFGPHMHNFEQARALLLEAGAAEALAAAADLAPALERLLADPPGRRRMGEAGRAVMAANRGALERLLALLAKT